MWLTHTCVVNSQSVLLFRSDMVAMSWFLRLARCFEQESGSWRGGANTCVLKGARRVFPICDIKGKRAQDRAL